MWLVMNYVNTILDMAVSDYFPFHLGSDDEPRCLINCDSVNINYLSLTVFDTMLFNPLHLQQDDDMNNNVSANKLIVNIKKKKDYILFQKSLCCK